MKRHAIPTADYAVFEDLGSATRYVDTVDTAVVIKASGLAAGKGVFLPNDKSEAKQVLKELLVDKTLGSAGAQVVIEERLQGQEASVMAFCDGTHFRFLPWAQDHKRVGNADSGANTGGMGAYAPAALIDKALERLIVETVFVPTLEGLRDEGSTYQGVLYAGLMITDAGLRVLEYNCRLGDPEAQVVLPLLQTPLVDVFEACVDGCLQNVDVAFRLGACATVVLAAAGYPGTVRVGDVIYGSDADTADEQTLLFHAGTRREGNRLITNGGRVMNATGLGVDVQQALERAYRLAQRVEFAGKHYRSDIGARAL
jgi:phosphoribosylamine--glycine ligase